MTPEAPDARGSAFRRSVNELGMRDGQAEESKVFSTVGKGFCIWFLYKYAELLISHENVLFVLLLFLIFPELIKKLISVWAEGRSSVRGGYTERIERHDSATTTTVPAKPNEEKFT